MSCDKPNRSRYPWENRGGERFLANRRFWEYVGELEVARRPWEFDEQNPERSIQGLIELRRIALFLVNEHDFLSPPVLWYGNSRRALHWGSDLIKGNFGQWKKVKRRSAQIWAAVFYPSAKRNYDFMLCVNKYTPLAITRILDAAVLSKPARLKSFCKAAGLRFEYSTARPILLLEESRNRILDDVGSFLERLELFKREVLCSIRELGEFLRFV